MDYLEYMRKRIGCPSFGLGMERDHDAMRWAVSEIERLQRALRDSCAISQSAVADRQAEIERLRAALESIDRGVDDPWGTAREALANAREQKP